MHKFLTNKSILFALAVFFLIILYLGSFIFSYSSLWRSHDKLLITDVARLIPVKVHELDSLNTVEDLQKVLLDAEKKGLKVSIAGAQHSQGGHTYYEDAVVLDMTKFNKILSLDTKTKVIRVQSGARWKDVQEYANPYGLAVKVMQSSYVFTIGGTLSANAHGRDLDSSSVIETVKSFRLLTADGKILNVSRDENSDLFKLAIGGYGLFGVILDVDIQLTDDDVYQQNSVVIDYTQFPDYFQKNVKENPNVKMFLARPSIDPNPKSFLKEMVLTTWSATTATKPGIHNLTDEQYVWRDKFFFGLSRVFNWAKALRWSLQKKIEAGVGQTRLVSRNNAMRPPLAPLELLDYYSDQNTDILQEYYIPIKNFIPFMDEFRGILQKDKMNVISSTVRYVKANNETYMAYCPKEDCFAIIQMSNVGLSKDAQDKVEKTTQKLIDVAIKYSGTYYLTYQNYPTKEQMQKAYPNTDVFFQKKLQYDPNEVFMSEFYKKYAK